MKDETCNLPIKGIVGSKSKMYVFRTEDNLYFKKANGINKSAVDDELQHEDYENVLFNWWCIRHEMNQVNI